MLPRSPAQLTFAAGLVGLRLSDTTELMRTYVGVTALDTVRFTPVACAHRLVAVTLLAGL